MSLHSLALTSIDTREQSVGPFLHEVVLSSLHWYYGPLRLPFRSLPFHRLAYRVALYGFRRAEEGLPSSEHNCPYMPIPLHRRVLPRCTSRVFTRSMAFAVMHGARLSLVPFGSDLTMRQDSLHVTACKFASPFWAFHRCSILRLSPPDVC